MKKVVKKSMGNKSQIKKSICRWLFPKPIKNLNPYVDIIFRHQYSFISQKDLLNIENSVNFWTGNCTKEDLKNIIKRLECNLLCYKTPCRSSIASYSTSSLSSSSLKNKKDIKK